MGKRVSFNFLERQVIQLWNPKGMVTQLDFGNDYHLTQFSNKENYDMVLFDGLWLVSNHYLTIQQWRLNFNPNQAIISKVIVWVRIANLPNEYYDGRLFRWIGNRLGHMVKVDIAIKEASRAKYARLSIEVGLSKPLIAKFQARRRIWRLEYEGIHVVCFHCGKYGHKEESCPMAGKEDIDRGDKR